jgi:DNA-binding FadR family transcriptional regulator
MAGAIHTPAGTGGAGPMSTQLRRETLTGQLVRALSERIANGLYKPGERLPTEQEMNDEFNVSRTVVREAIAHLRANGLVATRRGVGAFVSSGGRAFPFRIEEASLDLIKEVVGLLELRIGIESEAVALAAARRTAEHLEQIDAAMAAMGEAVQRGGSAVAADLDFHRAIARATGNLHFVNLFNYLGELVIPRTRLQTFELTGDDRTAYLRRIIGEHEEIAGAIRRQDGDGARAAMRVHLNGSKNRLLAASAVKEG